MPRKSKTSSLPWSGPIRIQFNRSLVEHEREALHFEALDGEHEARHIVASTYRPSGVRLAEEYSQ